MALLHAKTAAGRQEIEDRARRLPAPLRSILLMVDGRRDDNELRGLLEGLRAPQDGAGVGDVAYQKYHSDM